MPRLSTMPRWPLFQSALLAAAVIALANALALADDHKWSFSFGQGTSEATVTIACLGTIQTGPLLSFESKTLRWRADDQALLDIKVDGANYEFSIPTDVGGLLLWFQIENAQDKQQLQRLVQALIKSRQSNFLVEFPTRKYSKEFTLAGARNALFIGGSDILHGCD
jgi:hypothetical protein